MSALSRHSGRDEEAEGRLVVGSDLYSLVVGQIVPLALLLFVGWAFIEALRRSGDQFVLARLSKPAWIMILVASLLVVGNGYAWSFFLPFRSILYLVALFAALFFLGPECHRMGPPRRGNRRNKNNQGGW